jgi:signal peptidase II
MQTTRGATLRTRLRAAAFAAVVIALDQFTKTLVVSSLAEGSSRPIIGDLLRLSHFRNTGAAFGMLRGFAGVIALFAVVGVVIFAAIVVRDPSAIVAYGAALVAGGAAGNLIDRFLRGGGVVDFVDLSFWPAFNVADSAITIGAILVLWSGAFEKQKPPPESVADEQSG